MADHTNSNGLVDGNIPVGKPCPFLAQCGLKDDRCPTVDKLKTVAYSCGAARGWSLIQLGKKT